MPYHLTKQPAGFLAEVEAITIENLFALSCHAWRDTALQDLDVSSTDSRFLYFKCESLNDLLFHLLNELNNLLYNQNWIFNSVEELNILSTGTEYRIYVDIFGNELSPESHNLNEEIKQISCMDTEIENRGDYYYKDIIFKI